MRLRGKFVAAGIAAATVTVTAPAFAASDLPPAESDRAAPLMRLDVNGDGRVDSMFEASSPDPNQCLYRIRFGGTKRSVRFTFDLLDKDFSCGVAGHAKLDGRKGEEILLRMSSSWSEDTSGNQTPIIRVFSWNGRKIVKESIPAPGEGWGIVETPTERAGVARRWRNHRPQLVWRYAQRDDTGADTFATASMMVLEWRNYRWQEKNSYPMTTLPTEAQTYTWVGWRGFPGVRNYGFTFPLAG